jgi:hypothetical protein
VSSHGGSSGGAAPATTVTGPDAFGASAVVGTGTHYARNDHNHGLPAAPADLPLAGGTMSGAIAMGTNKITGLADGSDPQDAACFGQITGGGGGLLACVQYGPASEAPYTIATGTLTAVDSTNLTVSFAAPASGQVLIRLSAMLQATAGTSICFGLLDHTSHAQVGPISTAAYGSNATVATPLLITGLTPATVYQYDWAWLVAQGGVSSVMPVQLSASTPTNIAAPATMEVWSA